MSSTSDIIENIKGKHVIIMNHQWTLIVLGLFLKSKLWTGNRDEFLSAFPYEQNRESEKVMANGGGSGEVLIKISFMARVTGAIPSEQSCCWHASMLCSQSCGQYDIAAF